MPDQSDWTCDANDAVQITVVQPDETKPKTLSSFHPVFTYPIFGDEQQIFGYQGLIIRLRFAAHNLRPHVHISYDEKFKAVADAEPVDLLKALKPFVAEESLVPLSDYETTLQEEDASDFVPPGKPVRSYVSRGRSYEIWAGSLADPRVRELLSRAQVLVSLFIEAGTPLDLDDPDWTLERWTVYFVYETIKPPTPKASKYSIVGYATTYRWWLYHRDRAQEPAVKDDAFPLPEIRPADLPARLRIAQFLILPPHQLCGHGNHLYNVIHTACFKDPTIVELTVEDPNEAFDVLRDTADYHILLPEFRKHDVNINPDPFNGQAKSKRVPTSALIPTKLLHDIRTEFKIAPTQFAHILEMFLLDQIPLKQRHKGGANMARLLVKKHRADDPNDRRYYWWRMLTKQRLYKRSRDMLIQLKLSERHHALEETVENVETGYEELLGVFNKRERRLSIQGGDDEEEEEEEEENGGEEGEDALTSFRREQRGKRKFTLDDEEDEEEEGSESAASKRPKV